MSFMKTNSVKITANETTYDSKDYFGLAIENTDCIGAPVRSTENMVQVPGRDGLLDMTDVVFGGEYFVSREIKIKFGGIQNAEDWDSVISSFRNLFEGRTVKVEFATIPGWYFIGRCEIKDFKHKRALGTFTFSIPQADPYMYKDCSVTKTASSSGVTASIDITRKTVVPVITAANDNTKIIKDGETYTFNAGTSSDPELRLAQGTNTLTIKGSGSVTIAYKDGSL